MWRGNFDQAVELQADVAHGLHVGVRQGGLQRHSLDRPVVALLHLLVREPGQLLQQRPVTAARGTPARET